MVAYSSWNKQPTLIVIAGPTAVGKTSVAVEVARHFNTEIISADSRQFYSDLVIGTASPSVQILQQVKHHFIGNLKLEENTNVSKFEKEVLELLDQLFEDHEVVVMTGGSGLYIKAVCEGIDDLPDADPEIRGMLNSTYNTGGLAALRSMLLTLDPTYARQVDMANPNRIIRALEVTLQTGKPYSQQRSNTQATRKFNLLKIALNLPREVLHRQINCRVDQMIEQGLIEEARNLYYLKHLNSLNTVGYKELFEYFDGNITLEDAIEKIKTNTRRYARRQITWFKKDPEMHWLPPNPEAVIEWLENALKEKNQDCDAC